MKTLLRITALLLVLFLLIPTLLACAKDTGSELDAKEVIGSVDGIDVTYDELYFLVKTYLPSLAEQYGEDTEGLRAALDKLAREELIANPAIRLLCEAHGLKYKPSKLSDEVEAKIEAILQGDFGGNEEAFDASMAEEGISEHYLTYTTGLDILYGELTTVYPEEGLVITSPTALRAYILENFICTYHVALFNDTPEEDSSNYAKMTAAKMMLDAGSASMYQLIKGSKKIGDEKISLVGYNEDFSDLSGDGHYLTRGTWDEAYEAAAFDLKIGEVSEVVRAMGESPKSGKLVPTYYVIQRAALDEKYITENFGALQDEYYASVIYSDLQKTRDSLAFEPNEVYDSLDLTELPSMVEKDHTVLIIVLASVGGVLLIGGALTAFFLIRRKKRTKKAQA